MTREDIYKQVATLHAASIDQGFLATLGVPFLSLMYQAIDEAPGSVLIVDEDAGRIRGFVSGGTGMGSIYRRMLGAPLRLALALLPSLVQPKRLKQIFEILRYSSGSSSQDDLPRAELLSIAVDPSWRGRQIAENLYRQLQRHFRAANISAFKIVVGEALAPAHRFYTRMGAQPVANMEVHEGERSIVYLQNTADTSAP